MCFLLQILVRYINYIILSHTNPNTQGFRQSKTARHHRLRNAHIPALKRLMSARNYDECRSRVT